MFFMGQVIKQSNVVLKSQYVPDNPQLICTLSCISPFSVFKEELKILLFLKDNLLF
jgi:hypothetical protein